MENISSLSDASIKKWKSKFSSISVIYLIFVLATPLLFIATDAFAQNKFFSVPNRAGAEGAKGMAMIHTLLEENKQRKIETTQNRDDIQHLDGRLGTAEGKISDLEAEMADIEPHAKAALNACGSSGKVLHWDGGAWVCADEADPTVGPHARATKTPPFCHEVNAKLLWSADDGGSWKCAIDQMGDTSPYITAETDPTIQSVVAGRLCYGTGAKIACDSAAPTLNAGTLGVNNLAATGNITGTAAHFTGSVSGALPTATNHLATKAYVDSAVVAAGGGGGQVTTPICRSTEALYSLEELGGNGGADQKCASEFGSGFRFASAGTMLLTGAIQHRRAGGMNSWCASATSCAVTGALVCGAGAQTWGLSLVSATCESLPRPIWCCNF